MIGQEGTIGKVVAPVTMVASSVLVMYNGEIRQVWHDMYSPRRELRRLPTLDEASAIYGLKDIEIAP